MPAEEPMYDRNGECLVDRVQRRSVSGLSASVLSCESELFCTNKVPTEFGQVDSVRAHTIRTGCAKTLAWLATCSEHVAPVTDTVPTAETTQPETAAAMAEPPATETLAAMAIASA